MKRLVTNAITLVVTNPKNPHFFQRNSAMANIMFAAPAILIRAMVAGEAFGADRLIESYIRGVLTAVVAFATIIKTSQVVRQP